MEMNHLRPRRRANVSAPNFIIDQIRSELFRGTLKPGDKLPSEMELAELYGASRGSVRQAMKALEILGVVDIRPGDGTYVNTVVSGKSFNPLVFTLLIAAPSIKEMADARRILERDIFEMLIEDDQRVELVSPLLEENIAEREVLLEQGASSETLVENDMRFHRILSNHCGNTLLQIVYDYIMDYFEHYLQFTTARQMNTDATPTAHKEVLEALRARSRSMAEQAARDTVQIWYDLMQDGVL